MKGFCRYANVRSATLTRRASSGCLWAKSASTKPAPVCRRASTVCIRRSFFFGWGSYLVCCTPCNDWYFIYSVVAHSQVEHRGDEPKRLGISSDRGSCRRERSLSLVGEVINSTNIPATWRKHPTIPVCFNLFMLSHTILCCPVLFRDSCYRTKMQLEPHFATRYT